MHSSFFFSPLKIKIFEILLPDNVIIESWLWPSFFHITKSHFLTQYTHFTCKPIVKNVTASATGIKPTSPLQSDNPEQHIFQQKWGRWRDQALKSLPPLIRAHTQWMICSDPVVLKVGSANHLWAVHIMGVLRLTVTIYQQSDVYRLNISSKMALTF